MTICLTCNLDVGSFSPIQAFCIQVIIFTCNSGSTILIVIALFESHPVSFDFPFLASNGIK